MLSIVGQVINMDVEGNVEMQWKRGQQFCQINTEWSWKL